MLGTNSKALKICALPRLNGNSEDEADAVDDSSGGIQNG